MYSFRNYFPSLVGTLLLSCIVNVSAQNKISWLEDYTPEMLIGKDTYQYDFTNVEGEECKVTFKESVTNQKGNTESRSWIFYLSDIDPDAMRFNTKGKAIEVFLETRNSQKFISYFEESEMSAYVDEIKLKMNEVDKSRSFIEVLKDQIGSCESTQLSWKDREDSFNWLEENIGLARNGDKQWEQNFSRAGKPYLVNLSSISVDDKGEKDLFEYLFDLNDVDPNSVKLSVSGKSLSVVVPVQDGKRFMEVTTPEKKEFTDELKIHVDEIDQARQIVLAISHLVSNTEPERPGWNSYSDALEFVGEHLGEVKIGADLLDQSMAFDASPSGIVDMTIKETDSDGESEELMYSFYLADMEEKLILTVARSKITVKMETREGHDFIRRSSGESMKGYSSELQFNTEDIDGARDLIAAFEYAIANSEEEIQAFGSISEVNSWMEENFSTLYREGESYEQELVVSEGEGHPIEFKLKLTKDENEITETRYLIYPLDINLEKLDIDVSSGRLNVTLLTEKDDYVKKVVNTELQNFSDDADVYFFDPLVAKNFMAAIRFLKENTETVSFSEMSRDEAFAILTGNIQNIELPGKKYEQKIEMIDGDMCKLKVTRLETNSKGESDEFIYDFTASDIHEGNSGLSVEGKLIEIKLLTAGNKKLIKPYKNGEVKDFEDEFSLYADDVLLGKKIVSAFGVLAEGCK